MVKKLLIIGVLQIPLFATSLDSVVSYALKQSTLINKSKAQIELTILKHNEINAQKYGEIDLVGSYTHYNIPRTLAPMTPSSMSSGGNIATTEDMYSLGIKYSVPLFTGFAMNQDVEMSNLSTMISHSKLKLTKEQIVYNIKSLYLSILSMYEMKKAQNYYIDALQKLSDTTKSAIQLGKKAPIDLLKIQRDLYQAKATKDKLDSNIQISLASLEALSGMRDVANLKPIKIKVKKYTPTISSLLRKAGKLQKIKIANYNLKKSQKLITKAKSKYYPQVVLDSYYGYNYGENDPTNRNSGDWDNAKNWQISINAKWKIIDFGKQKAQIQQAKISYIQAQLEKKQLLLDLKKSIIEARSKIQLAYTQYNASLKQYHLAKKSSDIEEVKYKNNASSIDDLLYTKAQMMIAKAALLQSKYDYAKSKYYMDYILENGVKK
jgi:outer membrane protein TolC